MAKRAYRYPTVRKAVSLWDISEWFTARELYYPTLDLLPMKHCSITVLGVSHMLIRLQARGLLEARLNSKGDKEYRRVGKEWV